MKIIWLIIPSILIPLLLVDCTSGVKEYDLPSTRTSAKPDWVGNHKAARDTIFIVVNVPQEKSGDHNVYIQKAQSELHNILTSEIETILRDYWEQKQIDLDDTEKFQLLSDLPRTMEQIMNYVTVSDGWNSAEEMSILCALDYEEVADVIMVDMGIDDRSFLAYFKRRMDGIAQSHR